MPSELDERQQELSSARNYVDSLNREADRNSYISDLAEFRNKRDKENSDLSNTSRTDDLNYDSNGDLLDDNDFIKATKSKYNSFVSSVFGATPKYQFDVNDNGRKVATSNKNYSYTDNAFSKMNKDELVDWFQNAKEDENAQNVGYVLRQYDGKDENGEDIYNYKIGFDKAGAHNRYNKEDLAKQGIEIVAEKRTGGIEEWENAFHTELASQGLIGKGKDKSSGFNFGSGYTEFYSSDTLGDKFTEGYKNQSLDEARNRDKSSEIKGREYFKKHKNKDSFEWVDAIQSGAASLGSDVLDAGATGIGAVLNKLGATNTLEDNIFDRWSEGADEEFGYDRQIEAEATAEAVSAWNRGDYMAAVFNDMGGKSNAIAGSMPEMVLMMGTGGAGAGLKAASLAKKLTKAETVLKELTIANNKLRPLMSEVNIAANAKKVKEAKDVVVAATSKLAATGADMTKVSELVSQSTFASLAKSAALGKGFNAVWAKNTNNIIEDRIENGDDDISLSEFSAIAASQYILTGLDKVSFDGMVKTPAIFNSFKDAFKVAKSGGHGSQVLAKTSAFVAATAAAMPAEALQEYTQTWGEIMGSQVGVDGKTFGDAYSDEKNKDEALGASIMGAAGGGIMHAGGQAIGATVRTVKGSVDDINVKSGKSQDARRTLDVRLDIKKTLQDGDFIRENPIDANKYIVESLDGTKNKDDREYLNGHIVRTLFKNGSSESLTEVNNLIRSGHIKKDDLIKNVRFATSNAMKEIRDAYIVEKASGSSFTNVNGNIIDDIADGKRSEDSAKNGNPVKGKLKDTIYRLEKQKEILSSNGVDASEIDAAIEVARAYNSSNNFEKTISTVNSEILNIGFVGESGVTKPSVSDYESMLEDHIIDGTEGWGDLDSLSTFADSRLVKVSNIRDTGSIVFTKNVIEENNRMSSLANKIIRTRGNDLSVDQLSALEGISNTVDGTSVRMVNKSLENSMNRKIDTEDLMTPEEEAGVILSMRNAKDKGDVLSITNSITKGFSSPNAATEFHLRKLDLMAKKKNGTGPVQYSDADKLSLISSADNNSITNVDLEKYGKSKSPDKELLSYLKQTLNSVDKPITNKVDDFTKMIEESENPEEATKIFNEVMGNNSMSFSDYKTLSSALVKAVIPKESESISKLSDFVSNNIKLQSTANRTLVDRDGNNVTHSIIEVKKDIDSILKIGEGKDNKNIDKEIDIEKFPHLLMSFNSDELNEYKKLSTKDKLLTILKLKDRIKKDKIGEHQGRIIAKRMDNGRILFKDSNNKLSNKIIIKSKEEMIDAASAISIANGKHPDDESIGILSDLYDVNGKELELVLEKNGTLLQNGEKIGGQHLYFDGSNKSTIKIDDGQINAVKIIAHEYAHAITAKVINENNDMRKKVRNLMNEILEGRPYLKDTYAWSDEHEFIAEAFTHKEFRDELDSIKIKGETTLLQKTLDLFRNILKSAGLKIENKTALNEVLSLTNEIANFKKEDPKDPDPKEKIKKIEPETVSDEEYDTQSIDNEIRQFENLKNNINSNGKESSNLSDSDKILLKNVKKTIDKEVKKIERHIELYSKLDKDKKVKVTKRMLSIFKGFKDFMYKMSTIIKKMNGAKENLSLMSDSIDKYIESGKIANVSKDKASRIIDTKIESLQKEKDDKIVKLKSESTQSIKRKIVSDVNGSKNDTSSLRSSIMNKMIELYERYSNKISSNNDLISKKSNELEKSISFKNNIENKNEEKQNNLKKALKIRLKSLESFNEMIDDEILSEKRLERLASKHIELVKEIGNIENQLDDKALKSKILFILKLSKQNSDLSKKLSIMTKKFKLNNSKMSKDMSALANKIAVIESSTSIDETIVDIVGGKKNEEKNHDSSGEDVLKEVSDKNMKDALVLNNGPISYLSNLFDATEKEIAGLISRFDLKKDTVDAIKSYSDFMSRIKDIKILSTQSTSINELMDIGTSEENGSVNVLGLFGDNKIVSEAIKFGVASMLFSSGQVKSNLLSMDDKDLSRSAGVSIEDAAIMRKKINAGFIPRIVLRKEVLPLVMDRLGVKFSPEAPMDSQEKLKSSVEAAIDAALNSTYSEDQIEKVKLQLNGGKSFNFIRIVGDTGMPENAGEAYSLMTYMSDKYDRRPPSRTPYIVSLTEKIVNSTVELSEKMKNVIRKFNSTAWRFSDDVADFKKNYEKNKEETLSAFGYINTDTIDDIEGKMLQRELNNKIEREAETLFAEYDNAKDENGVQQDVYVPWAFTKSLRVNSRSNINVQESKIHREFFHTKDHVAKMENITSEKRDVSDIPYASPSVMELFEIALSQAFDLDPDKNSDRTVFNDIRKVVDIYGDTVKIISSDEKYRSLKGYIDTGDMKHLSGVFHDTGGGMHAVRAAIELRGLKLSKDSGEATYKTKLTVEADAITSGSILLLMKILSTKSMDLLEKGGIYTDESRTRWEDYTREVLKRKYKENGEDIDKENITFTAGSLIEAGKYHLNNFPNEKINGQKPFLDIYLTVGESAMTAYKQFKDEKYDDLSKFDKYLFDSMFDPENFSLSDMRKLAKDPTMVYNYGALMFSIKTSLSKNTYEKVIKDRIISDKNLSVLHEYYYDVVSKFPSNKDKSVRDLNVSATKMLNEYAEDRFNYIIEDKSDSTFRTPTEIEFNKMLGNLDVMSNSIIINEELSMNIMKYKSNKTIGKFFETALDSTFDEISKMRTSIKMIDVVIAEIFSMKMKQKINDIKSSNDGILTKDDFLSILKDFESNGISHTMDHGTSVQPLYNKEKSSGDGKAFASIQNEDGSITKITIGTEGITFVNNSGAAVTIPIHALDSSTIVEALADNDFTNIYDAVVAGLKGEKINESTDKYNNEVVTQSLSRNDLKSYYRKMDKMLASLNDDEIRSIAKYLSPLKEAGSEFNESVLVNDMKENMPVLSLSAINKGGKIFYATSIDRANKRREGGKVSKSYEYQESKDGNILNIDYFRESPVISDRFKTVRITYDNDSNTSIMEFESIRYGKTNSNSANVISYTIKIDGKMEISDPAIHNKIANAESKYIAEDSTKVSSGKGKSLLSYARSYEGYFKGKLETGRLSRKKGESEMSLDSVTKSKTNKIVDIEANPILQMSKVGTSELFENIESSISMINDGVKNFNEKVKNIFSNHMFVNSVGMSKIEINDSNRPSGIGALSTGSKNSIEKISKLIKLDSLTYIENMVKEISKDNSNDLIGEELMEIIDTTEYIVDMDMFDVLSDKYDLDKKILRFFSTALVREFGYKTSNEPSSKDSGGTNGKSRVDRLKELFIREPERGC